MKRIIFFLPILLSAICTYGQEYQKPAEGKSLVYFVRASGAGVLINFKYFDGEKYLGKINGVNYIVYECDPGKHLFWVASENRDFLTADLKPNATYIMEVQPTMGALKAAVQIRAVSPDNVKALKRVNKLLAKRPPSELKGQDEDMDFFIRNGMERYEKIKDTVPEADSDWTF